MQAGPDQTVAYLFQAFLSQRSPGSFAGSHPGPSRLLAPLDFALERLDLGPACEPWMCFHYACLVRVSQAVKPVKNPCLTFSFHASPGGLRVSPLELISLDSIAHGLDSWESLSAPQTLFTRTSGAVSAGCCVWVLASPGQLRSCVRRG